MSALNGHSVSQTGDAGNIGTRPASFRHSLDLKYISENLNETAGTSQAVHPPPKLHSSYSANDIPTVKNPAGASMINGGANNHAQQHFHNHNASIGRIPAGAVPVRHARELSNDNNISASREQAGVFPSINSALQASAAPFGPTTASVAPHPATPHAAAPVASPGSAASTSSYNTNFYPTSGFPTPSSTSSPSYGAHSLSAGMQQLNVNGANGGGAYTPQNYPPFGNASYGQSNQQRDSQARVIQHRRQLDTESECHSNNLSCFSFPPLY